jgi:hypothetical protein
MKKLLFLLLAAALAALGQELVQNGRFEDSLAHWTLDVDSTEGSWLAASGPDHDLDPDCEAYVWKLLRYRTRLSQTVTLATTVTRFAARLRLSAYIASDTDYYAQAALVLDYLDADSSLLGSTLIVRKTSRSPLTNTPTRHLIEPPDEEWHDFEFVIADELANLPGVNSADVARIAVRLDAYGTGVGG